VLVSHGPGRVGLGSRTITLDHGRLMTPDARVAAAPPDPALVAAP